MKLNEAKLINLIEKVFKKKKGEVSRASRLENVAKDSMDIVEFLAILKNEYGLEIDASKMATIQTVGEMVDCVLSHQK